MCLCLTLELFGLFNRQISSRLSERRSVCVCVFLPYQVLLFLPIKKTIMSSFLNRLKNLKVKFDQFIFSSNSCLISPAPIRTTRVTPTRYVHLMKKFVLLMKKEKRLSFLPQGFSLSNMPSKIYRYNESRTSLFSNTQSIRLVFI